MAITLRIDNFDQLPDGGPIEFTAGARGFDIGRGQHLDWCLPDESRFISTTHCEIRHDNGTYWLNDVSKNGTQVNGAEGRVNSPYRLNNGDRLKIGQYFVTVAISGDGAAQAAPSSAQSAASFAPADGDLWSTGSSSPQPVDRRWFANEQQRGQRAPDVMNHFIDMPAVRQPAPSPFPPAGGQGGIGQGYPPAANPQYPPPGGQFPGAAPQGGGIGMPQGTSIGMPPGQAPQYAPQAPPQYAPPAAPGYAGAGGEMPASAFIGALAAAAGFSPQSLASRSQDEIAAELGAILRTVTEQLSGLLRARAAAKLMARSSDRTMISAQNNNPLKFVPDIGEALDIMFARNRAGYLTASASFKEGFENIKSHEVATYTAMQKALGRIADDLSPDYIEEKLGTAGFGNRKAKAWDLYVERWNAKTEPYENGILDLFLTYFAEAYDAINKG